MYVGLHFLFYKCVYDNVHIYISTIVNSVYVVSGIYCLYVFRYYYRFVFRLLLSNLMSIHYSIYKAFYLYFSTLYCLDRRKKRCKLNRRLSLGKIFTISNRNINYQR